MNSLPVVIEGLNHYYGEHGLRRQILFDIQVEIEPSEIVILTGPSGSGKTTLLTLIGALRATQEGSLVVLGNELRGADESTLTATRRQIGYIFQSHNLLESLTAQQNVMTAIFDEVETRADRKAQRAARALEEVGLGDRLDSRPSILSGGQRQRVAVARALVSEPKLLLADEPTASLDSESGRDVVEQLRKLARSRGVAVVLVTHDNRILDIADRILNLEDGRLSSMMSAVTHGAQRSFDLLARSLDSGELSKRLAGLDHDQFNTLMTEIAEETANLLALTEMLRGPTFDSVASQVDAAFTSRFAEQVGADAVVMYHLDANRKVMYRRCVDGRPMKLEQGFDITQGLVGAAISAGEPLVVAHSCEDTRFDPEVDGEGTGSVLVVLVRDSSGGIFAALEARSAERSAFDRSDLSELGSLADSLGVLLESWWRMGCACRAGDVGDIAACCR